MKLGIYIDVRNPKGEPWTEVYSRQLDRIVHAERIGIDSVWTTEHHQFDDGYLPQPLTLSAAIASRTRTIRIGTAVLLAPLRPALGIAEEAAIVDLVSGGRLDLGLGSGYLRGEYEALEVEFDERFALLWARAEQIRRMWDEGICRPPPAQERVPIWIGVSRAAAARRVGRLGEGLLWLDPALLEPYREGLDEGGHGADSARMSGLANIVLVDDPAAVRDEIRVHHLYQQDSYRGEVARSGDGTSPASVQGEILTLIDDERVDGMTGLPPNLHILTVDQANRFLRSWLDDLPVDSVFMWDNLGGGMPEQLMNRHIELIAELAPLVADVGTLGVASSEAP